MDHNYQANEKKSVLLVDDDVDLIEGFKAVFEMEDYEVFTASNGQEALDMMHTMPESELPDMILLDYMMPVMNGEKFNHFRKNDPRLKNIPTVLMTANRDLPAIMERTPLNAYLSKPIDIDNLLRIAENFMHSDNQRILH